MTDQGTRRPTTPGAAASDREARWVIVGGTGGRVPPAVVDQYSLAAMMGNLNHDAVAIMGGGGRAVTSGSGRCVSGYTVGLLQGGNSAMAPRGWSAEAAARQQQMQLHHQQRSFFSSSYLWEVHLGSYRELCHQGKELQK